MSHEMFDERGNVRDEAKVRNDHPDTAWSAAAQITPTAKTLRARVLKLLQMSERGLTDEEMQFALRMNPSTQRPRRLELIERGCVEDSGQRRRTRSGRSAIVWKAKSL